VLKGRKSDTSRMYSKLDPGDFVKKKWAKKKKKGRPKTIQKGKDNGVQISVKKALGPGWTGGQRTTLGKS